MSFKRKSTLKKVYNFTNIKHLSVENTEMKGSVCVCVCVCVPVGSGEDRRVNKQSQYLIHAIIYGNTKHSGNTGRLDIGFI